MDNEIAAKLKIDLEEYALDIKTATKILDQFEKNFEEKFKIGIDDSNFSKTFDRLSSVVDKKIINLQNKLNSLEEKEARIRDKSNAAMEMLAKRQAEYDNAVGPVSIARAGKAVEQQQAKVNKIQADLVITQQSKERAFQDLENLFKDLFNMSELNFDPNTPEFQRLASIFEKMKNDSEEVEENVEETGNKSEEAAKKATILEKIFTRLGNQVRRQMYTAVASLINPINIFRKALHSLSDDVMPRLGATIKDVGRNFYEYIASSTVFQKIINYALYFIYLLQTIFNVIAKIFGWRQIDLFKVSLKSQKEMSKGMSKMLAQMDEITDIGQSSSGGDGGAIAGMTPQELFDEKQLAFAEKLKSKLEGIGTTIQEWVDYFKENWVSILTKIAIGIGLFLVLKSIWNGLFGKNPLETLSEGFSDLMKKIGEAAVLFVTLEGIAHIISSIAELINAIGQSGMTATDIIKSLITVFGGIIVLMTAMIVAAKVLSHDPLAMVGVVAVCGALVVILKAMSEYLPEILDAAGKFITEIGPTLNILLQSLFEGIEKIIKALGETLPPIIDSIGNAFDKIFNGIAMIILSVGTTIVNIIREIKKSILELMDGIIKFINNLGPAINNFVDNAIIAITKLINFLISGVEYTINTLIIDALRGLVKKINDVLPGSAFDLNVPNKISIARFRPQLAKGTNYVPQDTFAYIHKGEAVIPKEFNKSEYFGGSSEETTDLLYTIIERIDDIDFSPYIRVKDVGEASVNYINSESRVKGRSVI